METQCVDNRVLCYDAFQLILTYQLISGQIFPIQLSYNGNNAWFVADRKLTQVIPWYYRIWYRIIFWVDGLWNKFKRNQQVVSGVVGVYNLSECRRLKSTIILDKILINFYLDADFAKKVLLDWLRTNDLFMLKWNRRQLRY